MSGTNITKGSAGGKKAKGSFDTDTERWNAVSSRDSRADGAFYYSVKTTGVYCRPSCPSRPALRANVQFHKTYEDAERAGFRACKRCKPKGAALEEVRSAAVASACRTIESAEELPSLDALATAAGMSRFHFHRIFKEATGLTPKAYASAHRDQRMRAELPKSDTVTEAIYGVGFNSNGRFYAKSDQMLGMKPSNYRDGGAGESIRFAVGQCSLGSILVAASEKGICAISLADDPALLVKEIQDRFPKAQLTGGDKAFERSVAQIIGLVDAPKTGLALPLDVRGTAFQQRVWKALQSIPAGVTASYTEVAERIGSPKSVRAVASACAANTLAVAIPCHRVVRTDGSLSGYRWGVDRKRILLEREVVG